MSAYKTFAACLLVPVFLVACIAIYTAFVLHHELEWAEAMKQAHQIDARANREDYEKIEKAIRAEGWTWEGPVPSRWVPPQEEGDRR